MSDAKILPLDELEARLRELRLRGVRVVLCHGTFDLVHAGHIRHLQRARGEGDVLVVTLTADAFVSKGPGRPVFGEDLRAETLAALACVDFVAIAREPTALNAIARLRPDVYVKGAEYRAESDDVTGNIAHERRAVEAAGGRMLYTDEITFSSSSLLNEHLGVFSPVTRDYLKQIRAVWSEQDILQMIRSLAGLRVLVVGDAIVDQYHYVTPLGQTGKGNILAVRYDSEEQFAGGALATANHVAGFAGQVTLVTGLGAIDSHEPFVRSKLAANVEPHFFYFDGAPTVTKRRFVDGDLAKLFEVYLCSDDQTLRGGAEQGAREWLGRHGAAYDVVIASDFGNGFISAGMIDVLCDRARYLAVNTQVNSGNRGFHVVTRYPHVDFAALNEPELRLAAHDQHDPVEAVARAVSARVGARHLAVTRGTHGALMLDCAKDECHAVPALSTKVVDRVGGGDAFLALAALLLGSGRPAAVAAFVASAAAAIHVQTVCNREPVSAIGLSKYITTLLK
jgi:rfaE bifunctional protein nucleotidyltransferase chain/domain